MTNSTSTAHCSLVSREYRDFFLQCGVLRGGDTAALPLKGMRFATNPCSRNRAVLAQFSEDERRVDAIVSCQGQQTGSSLEFQQGRRGGLFC